MFKYALFNISFHQSNCWIYHSLYRVDSKLLRQSILIGALATEKFKTTQHEISVDAEEVLSDIRLSRLFHA